MLGKFFAGTVTVLAPEMWQQHRQKGALARQKARGLHVKSRHRRSHRVCFSHYSDFLLIWQCSTRGINNSSMVKLFPYHCTGPGNNTCTWFGEVGSCCCLPLLPQLACNILATTYKYYFRAHYFVIDSQDFSRIKSWKQSTWGSSRKHNWQ